MVNRESSAYKTGRIVGRFLLIGLGYFIGRHWGRKPINPSPENKKNLL